MKTNFIFKDIATGIIIYQRYNSDMLLSMCVGDKIKSRSNGFDLIYEITNVEKNLIVESTNSDFLQELFVTFNCSNITPNLISNVDYQYYLQF